MTKEIPFRWLVIVRDSGKTSAQYDLTLPQWDDPKFRQSVTAFNAFRNAELARSQSSRFSRRVSFTCWIEAQEAKLVRPTCVPVRDVWALFKAIDYDHARQEYA